MLDPAGHTPTAAPRPAVLTALRTDLASRPVRSCVAGETDTHDDGQGRRAEPNGAGGYHVGSHTLVQVDGGAPITWERFAADHAGLGKGELRIIFADLAASGVHASGGCGAVPAFRVYLLPAAPRPDVSPARIAADADLARLDAAVCQLAEARRRYAADTACNAWSLEQALKDVARRAEAAAQACAARAELA